MQKLVAATFLGALIAGVAWLLMRPPAEGPVAGGARAANAAPPVVVVTPVRREQLLDTVDALGTAVANESVTLSARLTDTVRRVHFEDGDLVDAGDVLIELNSLEEEALLAEARANLNDAEQQLARLEDIAGRGLAATSDLDMARARAAAAEARLDTVVARLQDGLVTAPFSGVLGFRNVSPGSLVTPTTAITTLDDISTIKLDFTVPETFLGIMQPGAKIVARSASWVGREFNGEVRTVGSRVDPVTRAIVVRAHIANPDAALRPGMLLTVRAVMAERQALTVPEGAVFELRDQAYVFRVGADLVARQQAIETGDRRLGIVEVLGGLSEGDLVVTEGTIKLRDGVPVRLSGETEAVSGAPSSEAPSSSLVATPAPAGNAG
jgi:membrane fusion protein (multidrug efflux system)